MSEMLYGFAEPVLSSVAEIVPCWATCSAGASCACAAAAAPHSASAYSNVWMRVKRLMSSPGKLISLDSADEVVGDFENAPPITRRRTHEIAAGDEEGRRALQPQATGIVGRALRLL